MIDSLGFSDRPSRAIKSSCSLGGWGGNGLGRPTFRR